jgi:rare lipoprotein A
LKRHCLVGLIFPVLLFSGCASKGSLERSGVDTAPNPSEITPEKSANPKQDSIRLDALAPSYIVNGDRYYPASTSHGYDERGLAYWYETKITSSGEPFDRYTMTAAHRTLPLSTYVKVTNLSNNRSVIVKINDRGPFNKDRLIDLSYAAAGKLGMLGHGTTQVEVRAIDDGDNPQDSNRNIGSDPGNQPVRPPPAAASGNSQDSLDLETLEPPKAGITQE